MKVVVVVVVVVVVMLVDIKKERYTVVEKNKINEKKLIENINA